MSQNFQLLVKTKRFEIPNELVPKLRELQAETRQYYIDKIAEAEDAVVMSGGMGAAMYLALDGRVIVWDDDLEEETEPREAKDVKEMFTAIIGGAKKRKAPELLLLLPLRPEEALDCPDCGNSGRRQLGLDVDGEPVKIICWDCGGIGWIINN
jgi:hypothetical protein